MPPDLPRLRTLETWLDISLHRVRQQIAAAEQQERERQQGEKTRPPIPDWVMEHGIGQGAPAMEVHIGGCHVAGKRLKVIACVHCRPDTALGML